MYLLKYKEKAKPHSWCRYLNSKTLKHNDNNIISVVGKTGSGKTYSAMSACEIKSKLSGVPFNIDNIVFSFQELLDLIESGKLQRGSDIIFDEPQASISSKDFQSVANKMFNLLLSTFRHRNYSLWFCMPSESMLDKQTRMMLKYRFVTESININNKTCRVGPYALEWSVINGKCYNHFLVIRHRNKESSSYRYDKIHYWDVPLPSKELRVSYEDKKTEFTSRLNRIIRSKLDEFNEKGKSMTHEVPKIDKRKPLTDKQLEVMKQLANSENQYEVADKLGVTRGAVSQSKLLAEKKGYRLNEFKNSDC